MTVHQNYSIPFCSSRVLFFFLTLIFVSCTPLIPSNTRNTQAVDKQDEFIPVNPNVTEVWVIPEKPTQAPTPTISTLDMTPTNPADFQLASGQIQFIEFFRFG